MSPTQRRLALKVDCDTFQGTKKGIPNLIHLFREFGIQASFFFTLGPDTSGRAVARVFTQKGFLKKMFRSNAATLYDPRTMLYGTLLPSPMIGERCAAEMRSVEKAGNETGVHGWDHIRWHDQLHRMSLPEVERDYDAAHEAFEKIFGKKARSSAAPGWQAAEFSLIAQEKYHLLYTSNTRGGSPFFPQVNGRKFSTLELPTTLPTWDEMLGEPTLKDEKKFLEFYRSSIKGTEVHSIHTEVEGTAKLNLFKRQLEIWARDGIQFISLKELAEECLSNSPSIPVRSINRASIPNRGGLVSVQKV